MLNDVATWQPSDDEIVYDDIRAYKYRVKKTYQIAIPIFGFDIKTEYFSLNVKGALTINGGYAWDGASGPTVDHKKKTKRASCVHDVLYQMFRLGLLDYRVYRETADVIFYKLLLADGMNRFRAWYWFRGVRRGAEYAARPKDPNAEKFDYFKGE